MRILVSMLLVFLLFGCYAEQKQYVLIKPGTYSMGSPVLEKDRDPDDEHPHRVTLRRPFMMAVAEVTQKQWKEVMGANPSFFKDCGPGCPVENVSWYEAVEFCNWLSDNEGLEACYTGFREEIRWNRSCNGYRLPTEAEWEYAARAGTTGPFAGKLDEMGWHSGNSDDTPTPVKLKKPNAWGLYDMHGNVWEWVWDRYAKYRPEAATDPAGPEASDLWSPMAGTRIYRGGSWCNQASFCRSAYRYPNNPDRKSFRLGFRVVKAPPPPESSTWLSAGPEKEPAVKKKEPAVKMQVEKAPLPAEVKGEAEKKPAPAQPPAGVEADKKPAPPQPPADQGEAKPATDMPAAAPAP